MKTALLVCMSLFWSSFALAQSDSSVNTQTQATASELTRDYLKKELIGIKPQIGSIFYKDASDTTAARVTAGFSAEMNLAKLNIAEGDSDTVYLGPSTGLFYSHMGAAGSNFFGTNPPDSNGAGANFALIPANFKLGYMFPGGVRVSGRTGANIIYRSAINSTVLSTGDQNDTGGGWNFYPNVGADLEYGPVILRSDWTIAPQKDLLSASLGVILPIG